MDKNVLSILKNEKVKFSLSIPSIDTTISGKEVSASNITLLDLESVYIVEAFLEKLLGRRVHIKQEQKG